MSTERSWVSLTREWLSSNPDSSHLIPGSWTEKRNRSARCVRPYRTPSGIGHNGRRAVRSSCRRPTYRAAPRVVSVASGFHPAVSDRMAWPILARTEER